MNKYAGTQSEKNLMTAFAGESDVALQKNKKQIENRTEK